VGRRKQRNFNLANWLVGLGCVALGVTFALPWLTAPRTARIEDRADAIALRVLLASVELNLSDLQAPGNPELLEARVAALLARDGIPFDNFVEGPQGGVPHGDGIVYRGRHYEYLVLHGARTMSERRAGETAPVEVYAYPADPLSTAQTAFFHGEIEQSAYTRNLQANYKGLTAQGRPDRGAAIPRDAMSPRDWAYRGRDDERWLIPPVARTLVE